MPARTANPHCEKLGIDEMGKRRIEQLKEANANLYTGYLLKEQVFTIYGFESRADAETYLDEWASSCVKSNLKPFVALGRRLKRHRASILAYFDYKISNGFAEGINNKVKVIKRMTFQGFRLFQAQGVRRDWKTRPFAQAHQIRCR